MTTRLSFTDEQLDLLADMIAYYILSDFGGGDQTDQRNILLIQDRVTTARDRVRQ